MSFKEVNILRKEGKIKEAYEMALADLDTSQPDDIWAVRAMSWVLIALLKQNADYNSSNEFIKYLEEFKNLRVPEDEELVYTNLGYWLVKYLFSLVGQQSLDATTLNTFIGILQEIKYPKPSELHSKILQAILKCADQWSDFLNFMQWWNIDFLREDDYKEELYNDRKLMSLAERTYITHSKKVIASNLVDDSFINRLENFVETHPEYVYPPYYLGKLLLSTGEKEVALQKFLPFAKRKKNDFWVWELLAETQDNEEIKISCLCKALLCKAPEKMLVKVHQHLAKLLIENKYYDEAKFEISKVIDIRKKEGWRIPDDIEYWKSEQWYLQCKNLKNNYRFYKQNKKSAENLLYLDIPEKIAIVSYINEEKKILNFTVNKSISGFFNFEQYFDSIKVGEFLKLRLSKIEKENETFYKERTVEKTIERPSSDIYKNFSGTLKINEGKGFAFVDNIYIPPHSVANFGLQDKNGETVEGNAMLNFNRKRNEWDWRILTIRK